MNGKSHWLWFARNTLSFFGISRSSKGSLFTLRSRSFSRGKSVGLGSGLIDQSQKMTVAAIAMAEKKVWAHLSHGSGFAGPRTGYARVDASPVLEFAEHVLDFVSLAIKCLVVRDWHFSVRF